MWRRVVCYVATDLSLTWPFPTRHVRKNFPVLPWTQTSLFRDSGLVLLLARWFSPWVLTSSFGPANENRAPLSTYLLFPIYTPVFRLAVYSACHLLTGWFLLKLFCRPWRWRRYVPPKRHLQLNRLHGHIPEDDTLHSNEPSDSIKEEFLDRLKYYYRLDRLSAVRYMQPHACNILVFCLALTTSIEV
jgi:hypothetical protein